MDKDTEWNHADMKATIIIEVGLTLSIIISMKCYKTAGDKWDYLRERYLQSTKTCKATKLMEIASWNQGPSYSRMKA